MKLLPVIAVILLATLTWFVWSVYTRPISSTVPKMPEPIQSNEQPPVTPIFRETLKPLSAFSETTKRPLFSEARVRPEERAPGEKVSEKQRSNKTSTRPPAIKLQGIVVVGEQYVALVREAKQSKLTRASIGDEIEGWEFVAIDKGSATLKKGEQELNLGIQRQKRQTANKNNLRKADKHHELQPTKKPSA